MDAEIVSRFPLRNEVPASVDWSPFDHNGCPRRSPRGSQLAMSGAASLSPRGARDLRQDEMRERRADEYVPQGPYVSTRGLERSVFRHETEVVPHTALGSTPPTTGGINEGEGRKHHLGYGHHDMTHIVGNDQPVLGKHEASAAFFRTERAHVSHAGQDSSVDEIVFGRDMDGSGAVLDEEVITRKGCSGRRNMYTSTVDEAVFGRDTDGGDGTEVKNNFLVDKGCSKKIFRGAFDASVDSIVFGRDTDGSGAVLDGQGGVVLDDNGGYFCTKGMDHYSNRGSAPEYVPMIPRDTHIVVAHNQNQKLHACGGGGRRVRWNETVPYHQAKLRDDSQFQHTGRILSSETNFGGGGPRPGGGGAANLAAKGASRPRPEY